MTSALVIVWDENDYANGPNQVLALVDTNYASAPMVSNKPYNHYSLTKTIEAAMLTRLRMSCSTNARPASARPMNQPSSV